MEGMENIQAATTFNITIYVNTIQLTNVRKSVNFYSFAAVLLGAQLPGTPKWEFNSQINQRSWI